MARNLVVNYGMLSIPMKSDVATEKAAPELKNLCVGQPNHDAHDPTPLTAPRQCASCGPVVDNTVLAKGIPAGGGAFVVVAQDEIAEAKADYAQAYKAKITLVPHDAETFLTATAQGDSVHYLSPAAAASEDHYALLAAFIGKHPELAFVGLHTPQSATSLYRVTTRAGVLVLEKRTREQGMKPVPSVGGEVNEQFLSMLDMSLPMLVTPYDAAGYEDRYANAVTAMRDTAAVVVGGATAKPEVVTDDALMAQFAALAG